MRVLLSIDMLRSGTNPVLALQPISSMSELVYFYHQRSGEQKLTTKMTTFALCDGDTDIAPEINEIYTLD